MREQQGLKLRRGDPESLVFDELLQPVHHEEVAVLVRVANVARVEPSLRIDGSCRNNRVVEIAFHHLRTPQADLSHLVDAKFGATASADNPALTSRNGGPDRS